MTKVAGRTAGWIVAMGTIIALGAGSVAQAQSLKDALTLPLRKNQQAGQETTQERLERRKKELEERRRERELQNIRQNADQYKQRYLQVLFQLAPDGQLTQEDVELDVKRKMAQQRVRNLMPILQLDLDGDAKVSAEELQLGIEREQSRNRARFEMLRLTGDLDGDGQIGVPEMIAFAGKENASRMSEDRLRNRDADMILSFDADGDGAVTSQEVLDGVEALAAGRPLKQP